MLIAPSLSSWYLLPTMHRWLFSLVSPSSMEHILYVMSVMNPPYGLNYCKCYWNHGLQRVARIEAVCVCFNCCEWECVWMSGMLIIWNGNKRWLLMGRREYCHDGIPIASRWYDDDINAWWFWILCYMMLIRLDDCIQETEGIRWKMKLECCFESSRDYK